MKELKIGDVIELEEKHKDHIKAIKIKMDDSRCLMNTGAHLCREAEKEL